MSVCKCKNISSLSVKRPSFFSNSYIPFYLYSFFSTKPLEQPKYTIPTADCLLKKHGFSTETASKVSSFVTYLESPQTAYSVLSFLGSSGFSKTHLENVVKRVPQVLLSNIEDPLKQKINIFQDAGISPAAIAEIISANPWILIYGGCSQVRRSLVVLKRVLGTTEDVSKVLKVSDWYLKCNLERTLVPNIEFLKRCGISMDQIMSLSYNFPRLLLNKPENIENFVKRADEMGVSRGSRMFLYAVRAISSMTDENWKRKLDLFRKLGLSEDDILSVFRKVPSVFAVSGRKIKEMTEILFSSGKHDLSFIVKHPQLLLYSIERRIKPRLLVMEILERENLLPSKPPTTTLYIISNKRFFETYVRPHLNDVHDLLFMVNEAPLKLKEDDMPSPGGPQTMN